ncbi:MAG: type II toxin-antitoxin system RelE family toxin [Dehalococcoidia bacterium]
MSWTVALTRRFARDFEALPQHVQQAIDRRIDQLEQDPFQTDIRKLVGMTTTYRVRTGDYRIIVDLDLPTQTATLQRVFHRREAYR